MHVVDLGSGAGDMAMIAAGLVGPTGSVLGIERSAEAVALATSRLVDAGIANVTIRQGDVTELAGVLTGRVDAVVGRLILMHLPDPLVVLRACQALRPGALVWFVEPDMTYDYVLPPTPLWDRLRSWVFGAMELGAFAARMGPGLHQAFRAAGLPAPQLRGGMMLSGCQDAPVWFVVNVIRVLAPLLEEAGLATAAELDIDTLESRLTAELAAVDGVMCLPPFFAAWARVPG
jgi:SAM-dependent methyltransferase